VLVLIAVAALIGVSLVLVQGHRATLASQLLHQAIAERDLEGLEELLSMGADIEALDAGGFTPLNTAVTSDSIEVADLLLQHGADLASPIGKTELPCLHWVTQKGSTAMMRLLLKSSADADAFSAKYGTPLFLALHGERKLSLLLDY
jgi:ankyrin repeat protein